MRLESSIGSDRPIELSLLNPFASGREGAVDETGGNVVAQALTAARRSLRDRSERPAPELADPATTFEESPESGGHGGVGAFADELDLSAPMPGLLLASSDADGRGQAAADARGTAEAESGETVPALLDLVSNWFASRGLTPAAQAGAASVGSEAESDGGATADRASATATAASPAILVVRRGGFAPSGSGIMIWSRSGLDVDPSDPALLLFRRIVGRQLGQAQTLDDVVQHFTTAAAQTASDTGSSDFRGHASTGSADQSVATALGTLAEFLTLHTAGAASGTTATPQTGDAGAANREEAIADFRAAMTRYLAGAFESGPGALGGSDYFSVAADRASWRSAQERTAATATRAYQPPPDKRLLWRW